MELERFLKSTMLDKHKQNRASDINDYIPQNTKSPHYYNQKNKRPDKLTATLHKYQIGENRRNEWILKYSIDFPIGSDQRKRATNILLRDLAEEYLKANTDPKDWQFMEIHKVSEQYVEFIFDIKKWLQFNFRGKRPKYLAPITLEWKYRHEVPRIVYVNGPSHDLKEYIERMFERYIKNNERLLRSRIFDFLSDVKYDMFQYNFDVQAKKMKASLKYSVILGSFAAYMMFVHNKEFKNKSELEKIKKKASRMNDIDRLQRYLRRIK